MPKAATFSGTRNTPRSTTAARTCSSPARGWRTRSASASRAATIRKRSAARKNGSPSGSTKLYQPGERHEQTLADGRVILIEERLTADGGVIGLRVDITELKQREASFRLLFDSNPVPMIVCALDDERILGVNDAAIEHYGYSRAEFEKLTIRSLQAFDAELPWAGDRTSDEQRGADLEACQGRRRADRSGDLFAPARLRRPAGGAAGADGHHRAQARRGAARLHGPA